MENENLQIRLQHFIKKYYGYDAFDDKEIIRAYFHEFAVFGPMSEHFHNFPELNVVIKGRGTHYLGNKKYKVKPGDIFVIPPEVKHSYDFNNQNFVIFHILFKNEFFEKYSQVLKYITGYNIFFELEPDTRTKFSSKTLTNLNTEVFRELKKDFSHLANLEELSLVNNNQEEKELYTLYLITKICRNVVTNPKSISEDNTELFQIMKSLEYIQKNYADKITIEELARQASMSKSSFFRFFEKYYNTTPIEYLNNYRIIVAKKMLSETNKSIVVISQDCGFFDSSHFIKQFKEITGITPVKYRKDNTK